MKKYTKSLETKVSKAVSEILGDRVVEIKNMADGEVNFVYKVKTSSNAFIVRAFRKSEWPNLADLLWIEKRLSKYKIKHARILYHSRDKKYFSHGLMITEYIDGGNLASNIQKGKISWEQSYFLRGELLRKIHQIKTKKFGSLNQGKGIKNNLITERLEFAERMLQAPEIKRVLPKDVYTRVEEIITDKLKPYISKLSPVLVHGDPTVDNIVCSDKGLVLIDWDNSVSGVWLEDWSELTYWFRFGRKSTLKHKEDCRKAFLKGYGKTSLKPKEMKDIEHALHVTKCLWRLNYYYFVHKDPKSFKKVKNYLNELLK